MATIEFRRVPVVNGKAYASMDEFKRDALKDMFAIEDHSHWTIDGIAQQIIQNADTIIEILALNTRSRPQMRKERKARKPRKQDATLPLPDNT